MSPDISLKKLGICLAIAALMFAAPVTAAFTFAVRFTAAIGLLMALLWLTEAVPMGWTALIPLVVFPLAGIASAEAIGQQYQQYATQITAAAKSSFLSGDQWAYIAGIVAILLGAVLVFFLFPKKDEEERLLAAYHAEDAGHRRDVEALPSREGP